MAGDDTGKAHRPLAENAPGPDVMLGLWASWMDRISDAAQAPAGQEQAVVADDRRRPLT